MATPNVPPQPSSDPLPPAPRPAAAVEDPEVTRLKGEVARSRQDLDQLKARLTAPHQPAAQPAGQMSPEEMSRAFYRDPIQSSAQIAARMIDERLAADSQASMGTLIQVAKDSIRNRSEADKKLFDKYYLEIEAAVNTVAPQFRGNITVWENSFKMVKGNHIDEILAERQAAAPPAEPAAPAAIIREGGGPAVPSARPAQPSASTELTPDEKRTARKLNITEDQYKAGKAHIEGQNDPVRDPCGPSSWDPQITFSTRDRRRRLTAEAKAHKGGK